MSHGFSGSGATKYCTCVQARLGTPEPNLTVYDHLDLLVHPLGAHLTERVATQFWVRQALVSCWQSVVD